MLESININLMAMDYLPQHDNSQGCTLGSDGIHCGDMYGAVCPQRRGVHPQHLECPLR